MQDTEGTTAAFTVLFSGEKQDFSIAPFISISFYKRKNRCHSINTFEFVCACARGLMWIDFQYTNTALRELVGRGTEEEVVLLLREFKKLQSFARTHCTLYFCS